MVVSPEVRQRWITQVAAGEVTVEELAERAGVQAPVVRRIVFGDGKDEVMKAQEWRGGYPTADEVWEYRWWGWRFWSIVTGIPAGYLSRHFRKRGWATRRVSHPHRRGSYGSCISHAPCKACGKEEVPVEELTPDRTCGCVEQHKEVIESTGIAMDDFRAEQAAAADRRAKRAAEVRKRVEERERRWHDPMDVLQGKLKAGDG